MSTAKHTPGPWFVYPHHLDRFTIGDYNGGSGPCRVVADCAPRACITGAGDLTKGEAESEANARLIAAAPEMLEILREVDEKNDDALQAMGAYGVTPPAWFVEQCEKIKAAITKSTGSAS